MMIGMGSFGNYVKPQPRSRHLISLRITKPGTTWPIESKFGGGFEQRGYTTRRCTVQPRDGKQLISPRVGENLLSADASRFVFNLCRPRPAWPPPHQDDFPGRQSSPCGPRR
jgi:hypothetical protein